MRRGRRDQRRYGVQRARCAKATQVPNRIGMLSLRHAATPLRQTPTTCLPGTFCVDCGASEQCCVVSAHEGGAGDGEGAYPGA
eukprot:4516201-Prymnesium_polylepis.1